MKNIFKNSIFFIIVIMLIFSFILIGEAVNANLPVTDTTIDDNESSGPLNRKDATSFIDKTAKNAFGNVPNQDFSTVLAAIVKALLSLVGVVFLSLFLYGGFLYMVSGGVEDKVTKARAYLINSIIGLIIIMMAYTIAYFIGRALE